MSVLIFRVGTVRVLEMRFDVRKTPLDFRNPGAKSSNIRGNIRTSVFASGSRRTCILGYSSGDPFRHHSYPVLLETHDHPRFLPASDRKSILSTTPTMAESIAAPCSPVDAVDAPQPS